MRTFLTTLTILLLTSCASTTTTTRKPVSDPKGIVRYVPVHTDASVSTDAGKSKDSTYDRAGRPFPWVHP
jgi:hypothetical protein